MRITPRDARAALAAFPWDSEPLVCLTEHDVTVVLERFHEGSIEAAECEAWADALEVRDDVEFETDTVREVVSALANPLITRPLTREFCSELLASLREHP